MILGSAVPTTVWSSAARKMPTITAYKTRIRTGCGSWIGARSSNAVSSKLDVTDIWALLLSGCRSYRLIRPCLFLIKCYLRKHRGNLGTDAPPPLVPPDAARLDGRGARRTTRGEPPDDPQRHRAATQPRLPGPGHPRSHRRISTGFRDDRSAAAPRRRRSGRAGGGPTDRRRWRHRRDRGILDARTRQARAGAAGATAQPRACAADAYRPRPPPLA